MLAIFPHGRKKYHPWAGVKGSSPLNKTSNITHVRFNGDDTGWRMLDDIISNNAISRCLMDRM